ncbi:uncharacterized protein LOC131020744 [Salvia miltiorrhiza]|uniref:uncharacterized protein LOC131020744 n=1 Tax=Salvia miltiorrhiza TaxID=226208 RepID=UPI0025ACCBED|nr:uncharacterized protein LOC131020744 [Salvia miltiorrhiza]
MSKTTPHPPPSDPTPPTAVRPHPLSPAPDLPFSGQLTAAPDLPSHHCRAPKCPDLSIIVDEISLLLAKLSKSELKERDRKRRRGGGGCAALRRLSGGGAAGVKQEMAEATRRLISDAEREMEQSRLVERRSFWWRGFPTPREMVEAAAEDATRERWWR